MAGVHITQVGDALDLICLREYGETKISLPAVLRANPDLASVAHNLPRGVEIQLPDIEMPAASAEVRLWD
jgi:phage tail protein X